MIQRLILWMLVSDVKAVDGDIAIDMLRAATHCQGYLATMWMVLRHGGVTGLAEIKSPAMLALCSKDRFLPNKRYARMYQDQLPAVVRRIILDGVGHVPALENPSLVAATIADFVSEHAQPVPQSAGESSRATSDLGATQR